MEIDKKRAAFTISDSYKAYKLSALFHADSFFYGLMDKDNLIMSDEISIHELTSDHFLSGHLSQINTTRIGILNNQFTIVPAHEYEPHLVQDFVQKAVGSFLDTTAIYRSDYQSDADAYLCYSIPVSLYEHCQNLFVNHKIYHAVSALMNNVKSIPGRQLIHLCRIGKQTVIIATEGNRLLLANMLDYYRPLSLLYYVTLIKHSLGFTDQFFDIELSGDFLSADGVMSLLHKYFARVSYRSALLTINGTHLASSSIFFPLRSISQCA